MNNIKKWAKLIQSEAAALNFLNSTDQDWNVFAPCSSKTDTASKFTTKTLLRQISRQFGVGSDYVLKQVLAEITRLGFVVQIQTKEEAVEWGSQIGQPPRCFTTVISRGESISAYSPQCAVLLYVARDHTFLDMTQANAVKAVLDALEKQIADDYPAPLPTSPQIVKVVAKAPSPRSFPITSWFVDASVSSGQSQKGTPLGTGVAAYNPATKYFVCASLPLVVDTTDAEALAIKYAAEHNPERVYSDSEACYYIMRSNNHSNRINAKRLLEPLRGKFVLEKVKREQNTVADKLAKWARYHQVSVAGYVELVDKKLRFSDLKSLDFLSFEREAKVLIDKGLSLEDSLNKVREQYAKLSSAMEQQAALDKYRFGGLTP